ncbi:MAG: ribosomal protein S18-alanine N-acetyltransferase [Proteobacteria bacterium]|nr:ribosomal protein S18-alanine N-acetyltransferase [Pseudomonadota bacterium]
MSAVIKEAEFYVRPMQEEDLQNVLAIETRAYDFPWTKTIFQDCLRVGYCCWVLERDNQLIAYGVMSVAVGESHILNLCVHPDYQSLGIGRTLLLHLLEVAHEHNVDMTFLEVRPSNFAAIKLYLDAGFDEIGTRRNYYPAKIGREDALIFARTVVTEEL